MELTRFYVKKTGPEPYLEVQPRFTIDPTVYDARLTLEQFIVRTVDAVRTVLSEFSKPTASARAIVGGPIPHGKATWPHSATSASTENG